MGVPRQAADHQKLNDRCLATGTRHPLIPSSTVVGNGMRKQASQHTIPVHAWDACGCHWSRRAWNAVLCRPEPV